MWLKRSDDLLATAWGSMDRYHLAWLMVGKPKAIVRGRPMTPGRGGRLRPRGRRAEDGGPADEPRRGRAAGDAVRRRVRRGWARAARMRAPRAPAHRSIVRRVAPACRPTPRWPSVWPRPGDSPTPTSTTTSRVPRDRTRCSGDDHRARSRGGWHAHGPGAGRGRARLPPPRAAPRPAHPGARRRVLRAGVAQGTGGHGADPSAGPPARRRRVAARPPCRGGPGAGPARVAGRAAGRPGDAGRGPRRRGDPVPRVRRPLLRLCAASPPRPRVRHGGRADRRAAPRRCAAG